MSFNLLPKPTFLFEADAGGAQGAGGTTGGTPASAPPATPDNANPGGTTGGGGDLPKTQEELNRLIGDRAKRAEQSAVNALLQKLGLGKVEELETVVTDHRKAQDAQKTELDKAKDLAIKAQQEKDQLAAQLQQERLDRAIEREAKTLGFADVSDASALVDRSAIKIENGQVSGVKEALEALIKAKPHLKGQAAPPPPDLDANKGKGGTSTNTQTKEEREATLKQRFRIN